MTSRLITEMVRFRSLQELTALIDSEISSYLSRKEEYSEQLGDFLREAEEKYGEEDWFKELSLEKLGQAGGKKKKSKKKKGKKKGKKSAEPEGWIPFRSVSLSSSIQGEAEIMFEAIEAITNKLEELQETKESVMELRGVGLGNDVEYICFLNDGVLKKMVIKHTDAEAEKFTLNVGFTAVKAIQPQP